MARLVMVVGRNGIEEAREAVKSSREPDSGHGQNRLLEASKMKNLRSEMDSGGRIRVGECSGDSGTRKPALPRLDDRGEVVHFCRLFVPLRAVLLASVCFVSWAERLTRRPWLEINIRRRPKNPQTRLSQCFPSVLMCSETTVISVCQKRVTKACREAFVTIEMSFGRSACFRVPFTCPWISRPESPVRKASANVRECPDLSMRLLK
ncbi:hypothetical protein CRG98_003694 [Punica granatum]|uniref:Uncharacterized protein n=1 Tax=Punica granatum TaxID=22663 RepID=A0A2I0L5B4_PUNGR|nr:hypothetical protein CRG98_003694 [Punica granatum]